jgi:anaerobic selenocysteine-containing dehydrogenase
MSIAEIKGYCSLCSCWCPAVAVVKDGVLLEVKPDKEHPLGNSLCPKGLASPELVYNKQRLQYPLRRTKPKGAADPGWERISWEEALHTIATRLNEIKAKSGAESVAFARSGPAGSPMGEVGGWVNRLANAYGSPNSIATTHICQWHRDCCSSYTFGNIGGRAGGRPEFERSACILIWGNNTHATRHSLVPLIKRGVESGAKLIVIDPRQTKIAAMADLWLQVNPGTDGALALSMINVVIEENRYDAGFVRDWTNAPFLVRNDTGNFLRPNDLTPNLNPAAYMVVDATSGELKSYLPGTPLTATPILDANYTVKLATGQKVPCQTAFRLLRELTDKYSPGIAETITGVPRDKISDAARMFATIKPACYYTWNGIEQSINASQTNRAICILYALTGNYDTPGGNVILPRVPANGVEGNEFLSPDVAKKRLGFAERPLGPGSVTFRSTQAYEVYNAILTGKPYPVKAMLGFGGNLVMSNAPSVLARQALSRLEFHAQTELFMSPTAELADIVLPAATCWESWHVGVNIDPAGDKAYVQLRPAVVPPQHESRPDMEVVFDLALRLGLGDKFWKGDIAAGFNQQFAPAKITVEQLRANPGGITINLPMKHQKYRQPDGAGNVAGFGTPSKRVEIYSSLFKEHRYDPLPTWREPAKTSQKYPLTLIVTKPAEFCHSQHRAVPSLRKMAPHPYLEINPAQARELGVKDGDRVRLETACGSITLQASLTEGIGPNVVCTQNGWWQACPELGLPGYDPYSSAGANVNTLYDIKEMDPLSGSLPLKGQPCRVTKV